VRRLSTLPALLGAVLLAGCALLGSDQEEPTPRDDDMVSVVDETDGFDPSEAVSDGQREGVKELEDVETEGEARAEGQALEERVDAVTASDEVEDDEAKAALAGNAPAEEQRPSETSGSAVVDLLLETLLVALFALALTALVAPLASLVRRALRARRRHHAAHAA
jgi:hypothetical protein